MKKNVASQVIGAQLVSASDGSAFTGSVTCYVTGDGGTQAQGSTGSGACTHEGNGFHTYVPAQAETNYDHIAFTFTGTGAVPVTIQLYTDFPQTGDGFARLGAPVGASISADVAAVKSDTAATLTDTNELQTDLADGGRLDLILDAILADTGELQTDWVNGGRLDLILDAIVADTGELQTDWADGGRLDLLIDAILADTGELQTDWADGGRLDLLIDSIVGYVDLIDDATSGLAKIATDVAAILADTNELQTDWADGGRLDLLLDAILADTGTDGVVLSTATQQAIAAALLDLSDGVETGLTVRQHLRLAAAVLYGKYAIGGGGASATFRDVNDTKNRIVGTTDSSGRTGVTLTKT